MVRPGGGGASLTVRNAFFYAFPYPPGVKVVENIVVETYDLFLRDHLKNLKMFRQLVYCISRNFIFPGSILNLKNKHFLSTYFAFWGRPLCLTLGT